MDQTNNVNLRWNKHQSALVSVFDALLDEAKLTDCTIIAEGRHLRAHKIILSACSPYFEELFTENNEKHPIIILHDVKYNVIKALLDFMYRGEVNIPQKELRGILNLSESLQVRGLSGSVCVDELDKQKVKEINLQPLAPETLPPQPDSVSCSSLCQSQPEEKVQSYRGCSPSLLPQKKLPRGVDLIANSIQKYSKGINDSGSYQKTSEQAFQEAVAPDCDNAHQLPSQRQLLPTTCNSTSGPTRNSACRELQTPNGEMPFTEKEQFLIRDTVLADKISANFSAHKQKASLETKSEIVKSCTEILDDKDNYRGCNANTQKSSGRNSRSVSSEVPPSQSVSVVCEGENEPEGNTESFRRCSPTVSPQEGGSVEVKSIAKSLRKYRKSIDHSVSDQGTVPNVFEEVITPDLDSGQQLPSQRHVLPTTCSSTDGPVYSPIRALKTLVSCTQATIRSSSYQPVPHQPVCSELQSSSREVTVAENEQFLKSEAILPDMGSVNLSAHQQEVPLQIKSEILESHMEIVEDLPLNYDDYDDCPGVSNYHDDCNRVRVDVGEVRRVSEGIIYDENFRSQGMNNLQMLFGTVDLSNMTLTRSQTVLHNRYSCRSCGKSYQYLQGLQRHTRYECGKEPQFHCARCNYRCARSDQLKQHQASIRCQMQKKYCKGII